MASETQTLREELEKAKENLKDLDKNIKKITGRDPSERRGNGFTERRRRFVGKGQYDINVTRNNTEENYLSPPSKKFAVDNKSFDRNRLGFRQEKPTNGIRSRLGSRPQDDDDDDDMPIHKKVPSSIVAAPSNLPNKNEIVDVLNKDKARNQRMFGALLGTLKRFKKDQSKDKDKEEQRAELLKKLEEKEEAEKEEMKKEREKLFLERKTRQKDLRMAELRVSIFENHEIWEKETRRLRSFIRTKAKPPLFYLPKSFTDQLDVLRKETAEFIDVEIENRKKAIRNELEKIQAIADSRELKKGTLMKENISNNSSKHHIRIRRSRSSNSSESDHSNENEKDHINDNEDDGKKDENDEADKQIDLSENLITGEKKDIEVLSKPIEVLGKSNDEPVIKQDEQIRSEINVKVNSEIRRRSHEKKISSESKPKNTSRDREGHRRRDYTKSRRDNSVDRYRRNQYGSRRRRISRSRSRGYRRRYSRSPNRRQNRRRSPSKSPKRLRKRSTSTSSSNSSSSSSNSSSSSASKTSKKSTTKDSVKDNNIKTSTITPFESIEINLQEIPTPDEQTSNTVLEAIQLPPLPPSV